MGARAGRPAAPHPGLRLPGRRDRRRARPPGRNARLRLKPYLRCPGAADAVIDLPNAGHVVVAHGPAEARRIVAETTAAEHALGRGWCKVRAVCTWLFISRGVPV